jgi:hypothetical protein
LSNLNRMIAIDNISRNKFIYVNMDGHANFSGTNGAGKTTTLRASLLFFGSRPGEIAKAKGDSFDGFAKFYFPNTTSYLVFEYIRAGKTLCVVCSKTNEQVQYQFLDTAFDETFFLTEKNNRKLIVDSSILRMNVEKIGHELTRKIGPDVYASIIQSNQPYRNKIGAYQLIRDLRPKYSLPTQGKSILNIDRVLTNIFSSKASVAHIQSALTDILIQNNEIPSRILKLEGQSANINEWFESRSAWLSLEARRENITTLSLAVSRYNQTKNELTHLYRRCDYLYNVHDKKITDLKTNRDNTSIKEKSKRTELNQLLEKNNTSRINFNAQIKKLNREVNDLEEQKRAFESGDKNNKFSLVELIEINNQLAIFESAETHAEAHYNKVSQGASDIVSLYDTKIANINTNIAEFKTSSQKQESDLEKERFSSLNNDNELFKKREKSISDIGKQRIDNIDSKLGSLREQIATLEAELKDVSFSPIYRESIEDIEKEITTADNDFKLTLNENKQLNTSLKTQENERSKSIELTSELRIKNKEKRDEQLTLKKRLEDGTLLDFIQQNIDGFEDHIGKVINPALLDMKGLSPSFENNANSFYGLTIDLDSIEFPPLLSKNKLLSQIQSLECVLIDIEKKVKISEESLDKHNKKIKEIKADIARSDIEFNTTESYLSEQKIELDKEKKRAKADVQARHEKLKDTLTGCRTKQVDFHDEKRSIDKNISVELEKLVNQFKIKAVEVENKHENNLNKLKIALDLKIKEQKLKIDEFLVQRDKDIEDQGLSPQRISQAQIDLDDARKNVRNSRSAGERVTRYNKFIESQWVNHQPLVLTLENQRQQMSAFDLTSKEAERTLDIEVKTLEQNKEDMSIEITQLIQYRQLASELIENLKSLNITLDTAKEERFKTADINECQIKYTQLRSDYHAHTKRGDSEFKTLESTFTETSNTPTSNFYEKMRREVLENHSIHDLWFLSAPLLVDYIENDHVTQADLLRSNYILVAKKIADFSELLNAAHSSLNSLGTKLTNTTKAVVERFEAIGQIDIKVTSKLKELSYFTALKEFSKAHDNWFIHASDELPDDALIGKLMNLLNMIGSQKLQVNIDTSFLFEVLLVDNGKQKIARTDEEIEILSSNGLSYLIITAIYIGLINLLRTDPKIYLLFCVDEIGKLSQQNTGKLITLFEEHNITIFSALPDASPELLKHYPYAYQIDKTGSNSRTYSLYGENSRVSIDDKINKLLLNKNNGDAIDQEGVN